MKLIKRKQVWQLIGLLVLDGLLFGFTNSQSSPSFVLIVVFLALLATLYYLAYGLLSLISLYGLSIKRKRRLAASLAGLLGVLLALQSVGQLNSWDILVLLPLVIIGYAYSFYRTRGGYPDPHALP